MRSRRFDQARPFTTLALAALAWLIVPAAVKSGLRATFFEFTAPIAATESRIRDLQEYWGLRGHSQSELIEAGRDLARVNASFDLAAQENASLRAEVKRLQDSLRMPPVAHFRSEAARVSERDFSAWWQRLTIRKGRNYGITVGCPVVFTGGVVGRVSEAHAFSSVVDLITSPGVRLAAFLEGNDQPVSFQGGVNPPFHPPRGIVEFVPSGAMISESAPQRLVTSGLGGEFPAGLVIGRVVHLERSPDGLFQSGTVELDPRLSDLTEVTVLVADSP